MLNQTKRHRVTERARGAKSVMSVRNPVKLSVSVVFPQNIY